MSAVKSRSDGDVCAIPVRFLRTASDGSSPVAASAPIIARHVGPLDDAILARHTIRQFDEQIAIADARIRQIVTRRAIGQAKQILVKAFLRHQLIDGLLLGAKAEFKVAHVIGRYKHTHAHVAAHFVVLGDDASTVSSSFIVGTRTGQTPRVSAFAASAIIDSVVLCRKSATKEFVVVVILRRLSWKESPNTRSVWWVDHVAVPIDHSTICTDEKDEYLQGDN